MSPRPIKRRPPENAVDSKKALKNILGLLKDYKLKLTVTVICAVISTVFRPKALEDISGKKVLFATTAPEGVKDKLVDYLEQNYGCKVIGTTAHLSNRPLLREDMKRYMDDADVMLTELKAAAVDVATKDAMAHGLEVVYCDNIPVPIDDSYPDLSKSVIELVDMAIDDFNKSS